MLINPIDLVTWAIHEIGHSLGLDHSLVTSAVMYNYFPGSRRQLTQDDIDGIQFIYGQSAKITGELACDDVPRAFQLTNLNQNVPTVTWSVSPSNLFETGSGYGISGSGVTANLKSKPSQQGTATLTYTLIDACGRSSTISKQVLVYPTAAITTSDIGVQFCKTNYYEIQNYIDLVGTGFPILSANFEVEKLTNNFAFYVSQNKMFIQPHTAGFISFRVRVDGYCGYSAWKLFQYPVINCGGGGFFKVYPNPAKESITIDFAFNKDQNKENQKQEYTQQLKIELYNSYQKLVFEEKFERNEKSTAFKINTSKLPNGVYYLKIINEKEVYTERIIIEN